MNVDKEPPQVSLDYPKMLHETQGSDMQQEITNFENQMDSASFNLEPTIQTNKVQKIMISKDKINMVDSSQQQKTIKITKISGS